MISQSVFTNGIIFIMLITTYRQLLNFFEYKTCNCFLMFLLTFKKTRQRAINMLSTIPIITVNNSQIIFSVGSKKLFTNLVL